MSYGPPSLPAQDVGLIRWSTTRPSFCQVLLLLLPSHVAVSKTSANSGNVSVTFYQSLCFSAPLFDSWPSVFLLLSLMASFFLDFRMTISYSRVWAQFSYDSLKTPALISKTRILLGNQSSINPPVTLSTLFFHLTHFDWLIANNFLCHTIKLHKPLCG